MLGSRVSDLPIAVIAANRPHYLFRMLRGLLTTPGVDPKMVTVYIDGFFDEPAAVAELFKVQAVEHTPVCSKNCRISQVHSTCTVNFFNGNLKKKGFFPANIKYFNEIFLRI